jgi:hypothetical protein
MKARTSLSLCALAVLALVAVQPAPCLAGFIGDTDGNKVTATAKSWYTGGDGSGPEKMVDGSAMSDTPVLMTSLNTNTTWGGSWLTHVSNDSEYNNGWVLFTFEKNTSLKEIVIWNLASSEDTYAYHRGMGAVTITYSTGADTTGTTGGSLFTGTLNEAAWVTGGVGYQNDITFTEISNVKAVKMTYTSTYHSTQPGDAVGLSEVRFAPEPATMALLGLGGLGVLLRRKRK